MQNHQQSQASPWEMQPWDTPKSYKTFRDYFLLQQRGRRSVKEAYRQHRSASGLPTVGKNGVSLDAPGFWRCWSRGENPQGKKPIGTVFQLSLTWEQRAQARDTYLDRQADEAEAELWRKRRRELRDEEWKTADALITRARQMMLAKLFTTTVTSENGRVAIVIEASKWQEADICRFVDLAYKLKRRAAELETERLSVVDWQEEARRAGLDPHSILETLISLYVTTLTETPQRLIEAESMPK